MEANSTQHVPGGEWDFWSQGLDRAFFSRVYTRGLQIGAAAVLLLLAFEQRGVALGLGGGMAFGIFGVWTAEATVRLLFNGGRHAAVKLAVAGFVKLPFMLAALVGLAWAAYNHHINIFSVVGGVLLIHAVMLIMVVATAMVNEDRNRERYR